MKLKLKRYEWYETGHALPWGCYRPLPGGRIDLAAATARDHANAARVSGESAAHFAIAARRQFLAAQREIHFEQSAECRLRALRDDAQRQLAYRLLVRAEQSPSGRRSGS